MTSKDPIPNLGNRYPEPENTEQDPPHMAKSKQYYCTPTFAYDKVKTKQLWTHLPDRYPELEIPVQQVDL